MNPMNETQHTTRQYVILGAIGLLMGVVLLAAVLLLSPRESANATALNAANALVESGRTSEAIDIYQQLIRSGADDSALYYNMGNAYVLHGEMGQAVASYSRASDLAPRDGDIQANLELALGQAVAPPAEPAGPLGFMAGLTDGWLSMDEAAVIVLALWFVAIFLVLAKRILQLQSPWPTRLAAVLGLFVLLFGISLASRAVLAQTLPGGLVLDEVVALVQSS